MENLLGIIKSITHGYLKSIVINQLSTKFTLLNTKICIKLGSLTNLSHDDQRALTQLMDYLWPEQKHDGEVDVFGFLELEYAWTSENYTRNIDI